LDKADLDELNRVFAELAAKARSVLSAENMSPEETELSRLADVRYVGQSYYLTIPLDGPLDAAALDGVRSKFNEFHRATYGYADPREPCELVNLRVAAVGRIKKPRMTAYGPHSQGSSIQQVYFEDIGYLDCPVVRRSNLAEGGIEGPAVIEEVDATTLIPPGWRATVMPGGALLIRRRQLSS
jgi:N-methylhydantoinase A